MSIMNRVNQQLRQAEQFNLFDNFTFSNPNLTEEHAVAGSTENINLTKKKHFKNSWEDEVISRISNINLQAEENNSKMMVPKEGNFAPAMPDIQQRNFFLPYPVNNGQIVWTERGPYMGPTNGYPYVLSQFPVYYNIPTQAQFLEPWPVKSFGPQLFPPANVLQNFNYVEDPYFNTQRVDGFNFNPNFCSKEPLAICDCDERSEQELNPIRRSQKSKQAFGKPKPIRKIGISKFSTQKKYISRHDEDIVFSTMQPVPIPKGARPILSSKKC